MPRQKSKSTRRNELIKKLVKQKLSSNKIQLRLRKEGLGVRRKKLLAEIRTIKHVKVDVLKQFRSVPRKYRKPYKPLREFKRKAIPKYEIYRISLILNDVPLHSRPFKRNYLGFRLQAFSSDKGLLNSKMGDLREILIDEVEKYLGYPHSEWWFTDRTYIGKEYPVSVTVSNFSFFDGKYIFRVERKGSEVYSKSGSF